MKVPAPLEMILLRKIPLLKGGKTGRFLFETGGWGVFSMSRFPVVKNIKFFNKKNNTIRCLPINSNIEIPGDAPMPIDLLYRFIEEAGHRVIVTEGCGCRVTCGCENYPPGDRLSVHGRDGRQAPQVGNQRGEHRRGEGPRDACC